jgi:hypothetical protein
MGDAKNLNFHCRTCGERFEAEPTRIADVADRAWQPHDYFAECRCGTEAPQAAWELNLAKAWAHATGPRTEAGKAISAANLPEETRRTRFNAMKSGVFAKTATYWPAKPGKYPHCETCEHFNKGCNDDNHRAVGHRNPPACLKRTELFMNFQVAFETRDPRMLTERMATIQALAWQMVNDMYLQVIQDGVTLKSPKWYYDKDGNFHLAEYTDDAGEKRLIYEINSHPLLRMIIEFMNRNGMALPDSGMTFKVQDDQETIRGFLDQKGHQQEDALQYQERQAKALEGLQALIQRSQQRVSRDPVLIEHEALEHESKRPAS